MKYSWEMFQFIDELFENYKGNDYVPKGCSVNRRILGIIHEFGIEMNKYGGDKKGNIYTYFINSIGGLVEEVQ